MDASLCVTVRFPPIFRRDLAKRLTAPPPPPLAWYKGYNGNNCETYTASVNAGYCDASSSCQQHPFSMVGDSCAAGGSSTYKTCAAACVKPATHCLANTTASASTACYTGIATTCTPMDCTQVIAGWNPNNLAECLIYNSVLAGGFCGANGNCDVGNAQGGCTNTSTAVFRACGHAGCAATCNANSLNTTFAYDDACTVNYYANAACPSLQCSSLVLGWDATNTSCMAYPSSTDAKWCDGNSTCATTSMSNCDAVQSEVGDPAEVIATCGSSACFNPAACLPGSLIDTSNTTAKACLTNTAVAACPQLNCGVVGLYGWGVDNKTCLAFMSGQASGFCDQTGGCAAEADCIMHPNLGSITNATGSCGSCTRRIVHSTL